MVTTPVCCACGIIPIAEASFAALNAEINRLRNALQSVADWHGGMGVEWPTDIARRALYTNAGGQVSSEAR
jgi:hypothetical protein